MAWPRGPESRGEVHTRHRGTGRRPAGGADQPVQLILRHDRLDRRHLRHLMAVRLGIVARQGVLTAMTLLGLDRDDGVDLLGGDHGPGLPRMAGLPPTLASTRSPAGALPQRLWGIIRWRARGVVRVLLEALQHALDGGLQRGNARFEGADILSNG